MSRKKICGKNGRREYFIEELEERSKASPTGKNRGARITGKGSSHPFTGLSTTVQHSGTGKRPGDIAE